MTFRIKDREAEALARQLSQLTGESMTTVVRKALEQRLEREQRHGLASRLMAIAARGRGGLTPGPGSTEDDGLYDDHGVPR